MTNTIEEFRNLDRKALIAQLPVFKSANSQQLQRINSTDKITAKDLLTTILTVYADIKKHKFHYWLAVPAIATDSVTITSNQPAALSFGSDRVPLR